jgi:hypothetical protein
MAAYSSFGDKVVVQLGEGCSAIQRDGVRR